MLPVLDSGYLPPGVHAATWQEVATAFGTNPYRARLLSGLLRGARALRAAGCSTLWVDGSFVTDKETPGDFDACWDTAGVDLTLLDPILLSFDNDRLLQKVKYGGEFLPNVVEGNSGETFKEFFQKRKDAVGGKGIVELDLGSSPP